MPRQQVYGKRSRTIYDPGAIFASPRRVAVVPKDDFYVDQAHEQKVENSDAGHDTVVDIASPRRVLGERNVNSVPPPKTTLQRSTKSTRRKAKELIARDELDEQDLDDREELVRPQTPYSPVDDRALEGCDVRPAGSNECCWTEQLVIRDSREHCMRQDGTLEVKRPQKDVTKTEIVEDEDGLLPSVIQLPPTPPAEDPYSLHCADLLSLASHPLTSFAQWSEQLANHFTITKIAEASFGEVYRLSLVEHIDHFTRSDESVFKVIALKSPECTLSSDKRKRAAALKRAEAMSKPSDVANEVKLLQRMSSIPGFTNFRDVRVLQGRPPPAFVQAFKEYNANQKAKRKELSNFPDPSKKASYNDDQLWAVIEMQDAGTDLERFVENGHCVSMWSVWDVFWQVVLSLAKGEEGAEFEHRDLHLGNICVRERHPISESDAAPIDVKRKLGFTNLETTIIDYTISRALMPDESVAYHDLATEKSLFEGDSTEEYQYDIYRYMRGAVFLDNALADQAHFINPRHRTKTGDREHSHGSNSGGRSWKQYSPITNLVWLHFVLYKLLEQVDWPSAVKAPPRRQKREHAAWKRANNLESNLLKVQTLLEPEVLGKGDGVRAASDLVRLALEEEWLDVEDVVGDVEEVGLEEEFDVGELVEKLERLETDDEVVPRQQEHHGPQRVARTRLKR